MLVAPLLSPLQPVQGCFALFCLHSWELDPALQLWSCHCWNRKITSLDLLAVLLLRQPSRLLFALFAGMYCWFRPSLAGLSRSCSARLLSSWSWGYSSPDLGLCIFLSWTSWSTCQLQLVKAFLNGRTTIQCINYSMQLCVICKLAEGTLCPISQVMMLSSTGFSIDPRGTWLASAWTSCCWSQPFQPVVKQFSVHLTVH